MVGFTSRGCRSACFCHTSGMRAATNSEAGDSRRSVQPKIYSQDFVLLNAFPPAHAVDESYSIANARHLLRGNIPGSNQKTNTLCQHWGKICFSGPSFVLISYNICPSRNGESYCMHLRQYGLTNQEGLVSNSSYLSALNSYPKTGLYRYSLVSPSTELRSNSSDRELPRDMFRFNPSRIALVGIFSNSSHLSALNSYPKTGRYSLSKAFEPLLWHHP